MAVDILVCCFGCRFIEGANYAFALIFTIEACVKASSCLGSIRQLREAGDGSRLFFCLASLVPRYKM